MPNYLLSYIIGLICWYIFYRLVDLFPTLSITQPSLFHSFTIVPFASLIISSLYLGWTLYQIRFKNALIFLIILALPLPLADYIVFGPRTFTSWAGSGEVIEATYYTKLYNPFLSIPLALISFDLVSTIRLTRNGKSV